MQTYRVPGAVLTEREHRVPLDHADPGGAQIAVFTREVADPDGGQGKPYLLFLQGGPGFEAARPTSPPTGWMARAIKDYRVLLLDQRGTGRSTPVGDIPGETPAEQAAYLTHFRADAIVRDAELIRAELGGERWSVLGQSFGGFTSMTYLSFAPEGLRRPSSPAAWHPSADPSTTSTARPTSDCSSRTVGSSSGIRMIALAFARSTARSRARTSACRRATD